MQEGNPIGDVGQVLKLKDGVDKIERFYVYFGVDEGVGEDAVGGCYFGCKFIGEFEVGLVFLGEVATQFYNVLMVDGDA